MKETDCEITLMLKLANKNFQVGIITMLKVTKENMFVINGSIGSLSKKILTMKKSQMESLERKNTMSETKISAGGLYSTL